MHKPSNMRDYFISFFISLALATVLSAYLLFRRGYFFDAPPTADTLYVANKVLAGTGAAILAFTFLIGPIVRSFPSCNSWLQFRKEIGIVGGFFALMHVIVSYFFLPLKFPQEKFNFLNIPFDAGMLGSFLLIFLFILSFKSIIARMDGTKWWFLQRWGLRLVIAATVVHVFVMKWNGWVKWITNGPGKGTAELANPCLPGAGILVSLFITWVIIVRLYEMIFLYRDFGFKSKEITSDETLRLRGRRFLVESFWVLVLLWILLLTRFVIW